jgi:hypothetical protein
MRILESLRFEKFHKGTIELLANLFVIGLFQHGLAQQLPLAAGNFDTYSSEIS